VMSGGLTGLAESIAENGVSLGETFFNQVLWVAVALLGVGLFLGRTPAQTAQRLGLRVPTLGDVVIGSGVGLALYGMVIFVSLILTVIFTPDQLEEQSQASQLLVQNFNTIPLALLLSLMVGVGEEIFFRGALQPIFGNLLTSLFFVAMHTQYTLTPASAVILLVSLSLGVLRNRQSTTATIIAHFVYNFVQLSIAIAAADLLSQGT
jgi:uncharacterized protein